MRKLVLVTTSFPEHSEGASAAGSFVYDLAVAIGKLGVMTYVVTPGIRDQKEKIGKYVQVYRFGVPKLPLSLLSLRNLSDIAPIFKTLSSGKKAVESIVESVQPDHIFALWALPSGYWAQKASRKFNIPYSVWCLGSDIWSLGKMPLVKTILAYVIKNADRCFADGYGLSRDVERITGRRAEFLPSTRMVKESKRSLPRSLPPYRFLFLGRWHHNKGIDLLLDALADLPNTFWQHVECVRIYGGGPLESSVAANVAQLQKRKLPVQLGGYLAKKEAEDAITSSDYVIIPSRIESIPVIFSDSLKLGVPVIATPVGDLSDLLREQPACGILANEATVEGIASALEQAATLPPDSFRDGVVHTGSRFDLGLIVNTVSELINTKSG